MARWGGNIDHRVYRGLPVTLRVADRAADQPDGRGDSAQVQPGFELLGGRHGPIEHRAVTLHRAQTATVSEQGRQVDLRGAPAYLLQVDQGPSALRSVQQIARMRVAVQHDMLGPIEAIGHPVEGVAVPSAQLVDHGHVEPGVGQMFQSLGDPIPQGSDHRQIEAVRGDLRVQPNQEVGDIIGDGGALGSGIGAPLGLALANVSPVLPVFGGAGLVLIGLAPALVDLRRSDLPEPAPTTPADSSPAPNDGELPKTPDATASGSGRAVPAVAPVSLVVHLCAVIVYAAVLSAIGSPGSTAAAGGAVLAAIVIQGGAALGRLVGGFLTSHYRDATVLLVSVIVLVVGIGGYLGIDSSAVRLVAIAVIGTTAGVVQTAALTVMMHHTHSNRDVDRVAVAWNIAFDAGLGLGALVAESFLMGS